MDIRIEKLHERDKIENTVGYVDIQGNEGLFTRDPNKGLE